jgi:hypothetical protein
MTATRAIRSTVMRSLGHTAATCCERGTCRQIVPTRLGAFCKPAGASSAFPQRSGSPIPGSVPYPIDSEVRSRYVRFGSGSPQGDGLKSSEQVQVICSLQRVSDVPGVEVHDDLVTIFSSAPFEGQSDQP